MSSPSLDSPRLVAFSLNHADFPVTTTFYTVNWQCSSSLQALTHIAHSIVVRQIDTGLTGGVESMTRNYTSRGLPTDVSPSLKQTTNKEPVDCPLPMGITSENVASRYGISRADQDKWALLSHHRAEQSQAAGRFTSEIAGVRWRSLGSLSRPVLTMGEHSR